MSDCICPEEQKDSVLEEGRQLAERMKKAIAEGDKFEAEIILLELQLKKAQEANNKAASDAISFQIKKLRYLRDKKNGKDQTTGKTGSDGSNGGTGKSGFSPTNNSLQPKDCCGKKGKRGR